MPSYFDSTKSFATVNAASDTGVNTLDFLQAAEGVVGIFDLLGSVAFKPVASDMNGNIKKIKDRYMAAPEKSGTLETLVANEIAEGQKTASDGLLWLSRGLDFTCKALQGVIDDKSKPLPDSFRASYEVTLKKYHSFLVKPIFSAAMSVCPDKAVLFEKLKTDPEGKANATDDELEEALKNWLNGLAETLIKVQEIFTKENVKKALKL